MRPSKCCPTKTNAPAMTSMVMRALTVRRVQAAQTLAICLAIFSATYLAEGAEAAVEATCVRGRIFATTSTSA